MTVRRWLLLLLPIPMALAQPNSLPQHETLDYTIEWRLITAGKARVNWQTNGRDSSQINLHVESVGLVSKLFKVDDTYVANMNASLCGQSVLFTSQEGSRLRETRIGFNYGTHRAEYQERDRQKNTVLQTRETEIPACVHEIVGALFHLRTLNLEPGQSVQLPITDGKKSVSAKVEAQQREDVKTPAGTFKTIRYEAYVFDNVLYRRPAHLYVWLTDDRRKLPVQIRVRMQLAIGTITLLLEKHE